MLTAQALPVFTPSEEHETFARLRNAEARGDAGMVAALEDEIARRNLPLVFSLAKKHCRPGIPLDDLIGAGSLGLTEAIRGYDPDYEGEGGPARFSTYATPKIKQQVMRTAHRHMHLIWVPEGAFYKFPGETWPSAMSIDAAIGPDGFTISGSVPCHRSPDLIESDSRIDGIVDDFLSLLTSQERSVIRHRYGFDNPEGDSATHEDVGRHLRFCAEKSRQIENKALRRMRLAAGLDHDGKPAGGNFDG